MTLKQEWWQEASDPTELEEGHNFQSNFQTPPHALPKEKQANLVETLLDFCFLEDSMGDETLVA